MRKATLLIALLVLAAPTAAQATAQAGDILFYKGERMAIFSNPLEMYFSDVNPRPNNLFPGMCSACWRGYVATWKIEDGFLYLVRLIEGTCDSNAPEIPLVKVFPDTKGPVKATWFSGTLRVPQGKQLKYVHMGYESTYEKELFIKIEKGKVIEEVTTDNSAKLKELEKEKKKQNLEKRRNMREERKKQKEDADPITP